MSSDFSINNDRQLDRIDKIKHTDDKKNHQKNNKNSKKTIPIKKKAEEEKVDSLDRKGTQIDFYI